MSGPGALERKRFRGVGFAAHHGQGWSGPIGTVRYSAGWIRANGRMLSRWVPGGMLEARGTWLTIMR